jgi:hypothetical protein
MAVFFGWNVSQKCISNSMFVQGHSKWWSGCGHLVLQMQLHVISFYGVTSRTRFMFLLFPQVSRNWRYESEPPLKPSPPTCYKQFGTNSIIVLMFAESQRAPVRYVTKIWSLVLLNNKIHIPLSQVYCVWQVVKTPTVILNNPVFLHNNGGPSGTGRLYSRGLVRYGVWCCLDILSLCSLLSEPSLFPFCPLNAH